MADPQGRVPASGPDVVVAIPVRNEAERIAACLRALGAQAGLAPGRLGLVLFLNNCTDGTEAIVAGLRASLPMPVRLITATYERAHAGWARRAAMDAAAAWIEAGPGTGTILTSDADSRVPPDWVARNLAALEAGADAVAGRVELAPEEAALLPPSLPARGKLEDEYDALITEIETCLDPDPHDPWPCHRTTIGASLAVRSGAYVQVGGMPEIPLGEDGAFVAALLQQGFRVRHPRDVVVTISARLSGRAPGGVADTIRARCEEPDALCDARMERVPRLMLRCWLRHRLRRLHRSGRLGRDLAWARLLGLDRAGGRLVPLPRMRAHRAGRDAAQEHHDLADDEFGHRARVGEGRVEDRDAAPARGRQIDLVGAHREAAHRQQPVGGRERRLVELGARADAQDVHAAQRRVQRLAVERLRQTHQVRVARRLHQRDRAVVDPLQQQDAEVGAGAGRGRGHVRCAGSDAAAHRCDFTAAGQASRAAPRSGWPCTDPGLARRPGVEHSTRVRDRRRSDAHIAPRAFDTR
ncbi:glycosyl transferase [Methylobacterium hispanicum]